MRSYDLYIGGRDREGQGWTYTVRASAFLDDPAGAFNFKRGLELGTRAPDEDPAAIAGRSAWGGDSETRAALQAAAEAAPEFSRMPMGQRRQIAEEFHRSMRERAEEFVEILVAEGHPRRLAEWETEGVVQGTSARTLDFYFEQLRREYKAGGRRLILARKPDGVVCLNPPQNAAGSNSVLGFPALLAGNTLVVKAPRSTPLSVMFVYREIIAPILERQGAPAGTLNLISGDTRKILRQWLESPLCDDLMFFGDSATGLKLGETWVRQGKKAILELSGNDGLVIWRDADLDAATEALLECFYGSSQICMVPKYALVHPAVASEVLERLVERASSILPGYPEDPDVLLSPVLKQDRYFDCLAEAEQAGVDILTGGRQIDLHGEPSEAGLFLEPTIVRVDGLERARELRCVREETFFPLLPVVVPDPDDDAALLGQIVEFLNTNEYGLRNSVWAGEGEVIDAFVDGVTNAGMLRINTSHIGFDPILATHGGTGMTGGPYGELHYPILRTSHLQGIAMGPSPTVVEQAEADQSPAEMPVLF